MAKNNNYRGTPSLKHEAIASKKKEEIVSIIQSPNDQMSITSDSDLNQSDMVNSKNLDQIHPVVENSNQSKVRSGMKVMKNFGKKK